MTYILIAVALFVALLFAVYYYDQYKLRQLLANERANERREYLIRNAWRNRQKPAGPFRAKHSASEPLDYPGDSGSSSASSGE